jgi:sugar/nucleoside kinase (ribokinase family)
MPPHALFAGLCTVDLCYRVAEMPERNRKYGAESQSASAGGPATNAAITFAHLGGRAALATVLGGHPLTAVAREEFASFAVDLLDAAPAGFSGPPPVSSIYLLPGGDRTVVSANALILPAAQLPAAWPADFEIALLDGHHPGLCLAAAREARRRGARVVLDGGSWKPNLPELLEYVDDAVCSSNFHPPGCAGPDEAAADLFARGVKRVAVTRGGESVLAYENGGRVEVEVPAVEAVDTLGAGDVFHGAYCYFAARRRAGFIAALRQAAAVAARRCRYPGPRTWMTAAV